MRALLQRVDREDPERPRLGAVEEALLQQLDRLAERVEQAVAIHR